MKNSIFVLILTHISLVLMYSKKWGLHLVGGMPELCDRDLLETVERETLEETGLKLKDRTKFKHLVSRQVVYEDDAIKQKYREDIVMYQVSEEDIAHIPRFARRRIEELVDKINKGYIKEFSFRIDRNSIDLTELSDLCNMGSKESGVFSYISTALAELGIENTRQCIQLYTDYKGVDIIKQKEAAIMKSEEDTRLKLQLEEQKCLADQKTLDDIVLMLSDDRDYIKRSAIVCECVCHHTKHPRHAFMETSLYKKLKHLIY